ncbi:MAG: hypothetical protein LUC91_09505, partial [Prevotella sp.]|nr:hypothetical protein [Prevotella sp.]
MNTHFYYKLVIAVLLAFQWNVCNAQQISKNVTARLNQMDTGKEKTSVIGGSGTKDTKKSVNKALTSSRQTQIAQSAMAVKKDSAYFAEIVKKNGWWVGVGKKLTKEEASHQSTYYKLTKKNIAGNWTYIESFNGYGNPVSGLGTYLVNQFDDNDQGANKEWKEKLKTVCKWEFIGDATGKEVIQERGLDNDGNVIYIYSPMKVGDNEYTGSFTDSWGMPVFLRTDSLGNDAGYANVMHITLDDRGFEVLCTYTDRFGFPQKDSDGAYGTKREYDDDGHVTLVASLNIVGDRIIDDAGNCGWEVVYENGARLYQIAHDAEWKPILMPDTRKDGNGVYGWKYKYDEWGRMTEQMAIDADGNPDTEKTYGFNKIVYQYNDHGYIVHQAYYDKNGNLIRGDSLGIAEMEGEYSPKGNLLSAIYKGADGKYVNNNYDGDMYCKRIFTCNEDESAYTSQMDYISNADSLELYFEYYRDKSGNELRKWYNLDLQRIDSVDSKGRNILVAYYDMNNRPATVTNGPWHKYITKYVDLEGKLIETDVKLDTDDNELESNTYFTDSIAHTVTVSLNSNGVCYQNHVVEYSADMSEIIKQWDITPYGELARVGYIDNLYYTCDANHTMYGEFSSLVGRNEFDEPSYLTPLWEGGTPYFFLSYNKNRETIYYDEYGKEIPKEKMGTFKRNLPKAYCIEVTDTAIAYPLNLRNGDIIISYGDWMTNEDLNSDLDYFYLETILQANKPKQVTLLRHNIEEKTSEIVKVKLPVGKTSDLGFYPHKICYTQKEKQRLLDTSKAYGLVFNNKTMPKDKYILMAVQIKGGYNETYFYHDPSYNIKDASLILCAAKYMGSWSLTRNDVWDWDLNDMLDLKGNTTTTLLLTKDMTSSEEFTKSHISNRGMNVIPIQVSKDVYEQLLSFYSNCSDEVQAVEEKGKEQEFLLRATVEGNEGYFPENGISGAYIVLEWCNWDCTQSFDDFNTKFIKKQQHAKKLTLL